MEIILLEGFLIAIFVVISLLANYIESLRQKIQFLSVIVFVISFIMLILSRIGSSLVLLMSFITVYETIFIASIGSLISCQWDYSKEFEIDVKGKHILIGKVMKAFAVSFAILWFLLKLKLFTQVPLIFKSIDEVLAMGLFLYIIGSGIDAIDQSSVQDMVKGFFGGLAISSLLMTIVSYIIMFFKLVTTDWLIFHSMLVNLTILSITLAIILAIVLSTTEPASFSSKITLKKIRPRILFNNYEISTEKGLRLVIPKSSLIIPLKRRNQWYIYLRGDMKYEVRTDLKDFVGQAKDAMIICSRRSNLENLIHNSEELDEMDLNYMEIKQDDLLDSITKFLREYEKERSYKSEIRMPLMEIIEGEDFDYVKIGPLVVYDSPRGSFVKMGPLKIAEGKMMRFSPETFTVLLNEENRGIITAKIAENKLIIKVKGEILKITDNYKLFKTRGKKIVKTDKKVMYWINTTFLMLEGKEKAVIKKPRKKIIADATKGTVIFIRGNEEKVIRNEKLAMVIIKRVNETIKSLLDTMIREPEMSEVRNLIWYLDELLSK